MGRAVRLACAEVARRRPRRRIYLHESAELGTCTVLLSFSEAPPIYPPPHPTPCNHHSHWARGRSAKKLNTNNGQSFASSCSGPSARAAVRSTSQGPHTRARTRARVCACVCPRTCGPLAACLPGYSAFFDPCLPPRALLRRAASLAPGLMPPPPFARSLSLFLRTLSLSLFLRTCELGR